MSMADLLAKQEKSQFNISRGQQLQAVVISILPQEIVFDLGSKAEGILPKRELTQDTLDKIKIGDKLEVFVVSPEDESGQVVLALHQQRSGRQPANIGKWNKFLDGLKSGQTFTGKGAEINKGGLIVESLGLRGFVPSSQLTPSAVAQVEDLIGKEISLKVIEVDPAQNRLIFAQKVRVDEATKKLLQEMKAGDKVKGKISAILPFGVLVKLDNGVEGFVHLTESAWEKVEDPNQLFKLGQEIEAQIILIEPADGKVSLSTKVLQQDPFIKLAQKYQGDDVVKATVSRLADNGIYFSLEDGVEGFMSRDAAQPGQTYIVGQSMNVLIDKVDAQRRKITLAPLLTSTSGLIYK